jgi:tetratricopeptide (TPR) repeat protein
MAAPGPVADGPAALAEGRWEEARAAFEAALARGEAETGQACFGLAMALWWLGENRACVDRYSRAYALYRASGDVEGAARCAVWLAITYKSNFANFAAANGWVVRAERLLEPFDPGPMHGWVRLARAYRMTDLDEAEELTGWAVRMARTARDVDLELVASSQLGLIRVGKGLTDAGFALIDEAMAAALAGERLTFDTVVFACCDMLSACELVSDIERAAQWCQVADDFVARYGCPFLYAECRIYCGSVLAATGRWDDADRELNAGARITDGACPGLHSRALVRLAALRLRQGRLEEAKGLLAAAGGDIGAETEGWVLAAALSLARGDALAAARRLEQHLRHLQEHRLQLGAALGLLVDAYLDAGHLDPAAGAAARPGGAGPRRRRGDHRPGGRADAVVVARAAAGGSPGPVRAGPRPGRQRIRDRHRARPARPGRIREPRRGPGRRPRRRVPPRGGGRAPHRSQGNGNAHRTGERGARAGRGRTVQPRDRRAPAHQPQDGVPPRQQHPDQAGAAEPGRGGRAPGTADGAVARC